MNNVETVKEYYNQNPQIEWNRLEGRMPEFEITMRHLKENLVPRSTIIDVGGGTGRYSFSLTNLGHKVTLFDLSDGNIAFAKNKSMELGITLENYICGSAVSLLDFVNEQYDAVLCLGPLYHLNNEYDRIAVINNCLSILKPNGIIALGFISAFSKYTSVLKSVSAMMNNGDDMDLIRQKYFETAPHLLSYAQNNKAAFERTDSSFTTSNFTNPLMITQFIESFGAETIALTSVECLLTHHNELRFLPKDIYESLLDVTYHYAKHQTLFGSSEHILYIGRKAK